jgi:dolichol-phosphate mannosyltransferase
VDIFASAPRPLKFAEVPYTFRQRHSGTSKLDELVAWEYLMLVLDKLVGRFVPARFISFSLIGGAGVFVHMAILAALHRGGLVPFLAAQISATGGAMVFNYTINNLLTYRDRRLRGAKWLLGLVSFSAGCAVGALANVGIADYLFDRDHVWFAAALAGVVVGAVWNFAITSVFTWGGTNK